MKITKCKCGCASFFTEEHGNQTGLYCSACAKEIQEEEGHEK